MNKDLRSEYETQLEDIASSLLDLQSSTFDKYMKMVDENRFLKLLIERLTESSLDDDRVYAKYSENVNGF